MTEISGASRDPTYFDRLYARHDDPWHFRTSTYEREKYAATLGALPRQRYRHAVEIGCSIGELTLLLAQRCDNVLGIDTASAALRAARQRCAGCANVRFKKMHVPAEWPEGSTDLLVLSEVLYFLSADDIDAVAAHARKSLAPDGTILLVNWLGLTDGPCNGEQAAEKFIAAAADFRSIREHCTGKYRIDVLGK